MLNTHDIQEIQFRVILRRKSVNSTKHIFKKSQAFAYHRFFFVCNLGTHRTHKYELLDHDQDQMISLMAMNGLKQNRRYKSYLTLTWLQLGV